MSRSARGSRGIRKILLVVLALALPTALAYPQTLSQGEIRDLIQAFKKDERGPYKAIRWFCPDGSVLPPDKRCPQPGGIQHALHKDVVLRIAKEEGIYLGQILAGASLEDFLDESHENERLKQYLLQQYLQRVDDGWIMRRARYYRGAIQAENEAEWGVRFLRDLAARDETVESQFFLLRQAVKEIPHGADHARWDLIRARSKAIAEAFAPFSNLRVKIHGRPDPEDIERVHQFLESHRKTMPTEVQAMTKKLITELGDAYRPDHLPFLKACLRQLPDGLSVKKELKAWIDHCGDSMARSTGREDLVEGRARSTAPLLWNIRQSLRSVMEPRTRLALLDLSNHLEQILFQDGNAWNPRTLSNLLEKGHVLAQGAAGCGFLEVWEWEETEPLLRLQSAGKDSLSFETLKALVACYRRIVEWGTAMVIACYGPTVELFCGFEPIAAGFVDDRIRSTPLLPLGDAAADLSELLAQSAGTPSYVLGRRNQREAHGVNPGFAVGELEFLAGDDQGTANLSPKRIYVFPEAPSDLKPVAGILTASTGNLVSHVQLLARNLGIPNAEISSILLNELKPLSGQSVFYAVSPQGRVLLKPASEMSQEEKELAEVRRRGQEKILVPMEKIDLEETGLISLRSLRASDSGRVCGPKAANLGQLKSLFPDKVTDGLVIPFGVFRQHLDQPMPGGACTHGEFLRETFSMAEEERRARRSEEQIERAILERLGRLRESIRNIPLSGGFQKELRKRFKQEFGEKPGRLPVFIRSDTNMEDLKDFTGAGLNLTVFNVLEEELILEAIRDVWASAFSERSYSWRQKYLLNPENVYPSILILPSVNVEKSGVLVTTGIMAGNARDTTVAFNRGVGGAVEGQAAESYLLRTDGTRLLLSPSRETRFTVLPTTGGTERLATRLNHPILDATELEQLLKISGEIRQELPGTPGIETGGPFDVELGFKSGNIWLFQVRPYVENKRARSSAYLRSLDPALPREVRLPLELPIVSTER